VSARTDAEARRDRLATHLRESRIGRHWTASELGALPDYRDVYRGHAHVLQDLEALAARGVVTRWPGRPDRWSLTEHDDR
jgi:hypothetical protein